MKSIKIQKYQKSLKSSALKTHIKLIKIQILAKFAKNP